MKRMKRQDDFAQRRKHIADLSDQELYDRFWELTAQVVDPLLELGRKNTTPSVERAVLLRMGISSLDTQKIVEGCMDRGLMGHGAGHVVYKVSKEKGVSIREAGEMLAKGEGWDEAAALFKKGGK
jgi:D-ornithine 4,5-aminomutase subunit alpha